MKHGGGNLIFNFYIKLEKSSEGVVDSSKLSFLEIF